MEKWQKYRRELPYSYCFGPYPSFRLLEEAPERVLALLLSDKFKEKEKVEALAAEKALPLIYAPRLIEKLSQRANTYMIAVFMKELPSSGKSKALSLKAERTFQNTLSNPAKENSTSGRQVILQNIDDMGNLGTILRSLLAFDCPCLNLLGPCCDLWDPRVVRASMGAIFALRLQFYSSLEAWRERNSELLLAALMLDKTAESPRSWLSQRSVEELSGLCLAFGNEGSGLPSYYRESADACLMIPQSLKVDSLNLAEAVSISLYEWQEQFHARSAAKAPPSAPFSFSPSTSLGWL